MIHNKHFGLEEARELLPGIILKITRIVDLKKTLDEKGYDILKHQFFGGFGPNGTGRFPSELEELVKIFKDVTKDGILIKDINSGLIDFPHLRKNGEEVYLCFLLGEKDITYWHRTGDGFAGRREIDEL
jgi:hypothetical protein